MSEKVSEMKNKVVVLDTGYESYAYEEKLLSDAGYRFILFEGDWHDQCAKIDFAKDAVGIFIRWTKIDDEFLSQMQHLQAIVRYGVGYDNIDLTAANKFNIKVANVQGYANHAVSDHALMLMYACARQLPLGQKLLRSEFGKPPAKNVFEFHDRTLGIIGLGRIGGTLAKKTRHLFSRILAADPYIDQARFTEIGAVQSSLEQLLLESDVISIHCNLTAETKRLLHQPQFRQMAKIPILINTARGPVIDEDDLTEALKSGLLHSAGIDVYWDEPPKENRNDLLNLPNVISTGHYAWYSTNAAIELQKRAADNLLMLLRGEIPEDCLNCE